MKASLRKWTAAILLSCLALPAGPAAAAESEPNAAPFLVIDAKSGEVLAQNRAGETWYPASLTKLFTAYVVFQRLREGKMSLNQQVYVTSRAARQEPSKIGVPWGQTVTVDFALQAMLVYSANDMAVALAEAAGGSVEKFAAGMNGMAHNIGLSASHFVNPNGLYDPRQVSSARDIAIIAALIYNEFPQYAHYFSQSYISAGRRKLPNRNALLRMMPDADGMKTGFVCSAGFNLVASATRNGRKLIAVVLGARNGGTRSLMAKNLLEAGFLKLSGPPGQPGPPAPPAQKVAEIVDLPQGAVVPADMSAAVCRGESSIELAGAEGLSGWAISFGTYDDMRKADMALRGRLLSPVGIETRSSAGIVRLPAKAGYAAMMWNIPQEESLRLCNAYRADGAICNIMPPVMVDQIAAGLRAAAPPPKTVAQGSEGNEPAKKPATKRVRKKLKSRQ